MENLSLLNNTILKSIQRYMKKMLLVGFVLLATIAKAQYPLKTIQEVQFVADQDLQAGNDASSYSALDTIRIHGVVIMDANLSTLVGGKQIWIQTNDGSDFSGIDIYQNFPGSGTPGDAGTGILDLVQGDSIEITGTVLEFQGETEFVPINTDPATPIQLLGSGITVKSKLILAEELNDANRVNKLPTGEKYEGQYVELRDMTVSSVDYFSNGARVSFNIVDAAGNKVNVSDRFKSQRMPAMGGTFVPPNVGDRITSIKGILAHDKNGRGYELHPFSSSDIVYGAAAPAITGISKNVLVPTGSDVVTVTANITDKDGIGSAKLYYADGVTNHIYTAVDMVANGNTYSANIPAHADGHFVKFFIEATDVSQDALVARVPNVPVEEPRFFIVRNNGLSIFDLQYTPFSSGNSAFVDQTVTVTGVVTSSSTDLGVVFIQQENHSAWAGILCEGNAQLSQLQLGDRVTVTGTVKENFGFTKLTNITNIQSNGTGTITPLVLEADSFRTYSMTANEPYESMLVRFAPPAGHLYVVNKNADAPSNFAEYRVGKDKTDPGAGCRVLVGRVTSTVFSSKNVSYVNDSMWTPNPTIPIIVVHEGDSMVALTGIINYSFNNMKILPRNNADFEGISSSVGFASTYLKKGNVVAYPNPTSNAIYFDFILPNDARRNVLKVYNVLGEELYVNQLDGVSGTAHINTNGFSQGTYIYTIYSANQGVLTTGRFVISK